MYQSFSPPLKPKNGGVLKVLDVERISTVHQDERSLDDQRQLVRKYVSDRYEGEVEFVSVASRISGERLDSKAFNTIEAHIETGGFDLLIVEDLGRICRRLHAYMVIEHAEDHGTRVIAINDHLDTGSDNWRNNALFAVLHHQQHNHDTASRIRRSHRNRFVQGGVVLDTIFGFEKPKGCKSDDELRKLPEAEPIYEEWFSILERGGTYSEVADYLNANNVPTGPASRSKTWTPKAVSRVTRNPLIKGVRVRNDRMSKRVNSTGRRKSIKAPKEERLERHCPHLVFIEPERFDRLMRELEKRNGKYSRGKAAKRDPRAGVAKKRTLWPGQSMHCGICGSLLYYGAHGCKNRLCCSGALSYKCWNGTSISGPKTAARICEEVWKFVEQLPEFDDAFLRMISEEFELQGSDTTERLKGLKNRLETISRESDNLLAAIRNGKAFDLLTQDLERLQSERRDVDDEIHRLEQAQKKRPNLPSMDALRSKAAEIFRDMPRESQDFGRLMNGIVRSITVHPYVPIDGGNIVLRATFELHLSSLSGSDSVDLPNLMHELTVDLFDPPQRIEYLEEVRRLTSTSEDGVKLKERDIAARLGITQTAVQRAKHLARNMDANSVSDPYVRIEQPLEHGRNRRHRHPRFHAG